MSRVYFTQAYKAALSAAIVATQAMRDDHKVRFDQIVREQKRPSRKFKEIVKPRHERRQASLNRAIEAMQEAMKP